MRSSVAGHSLTECEPLVESALRFATTLLKYSETFYPFGLLSVAGDVQNVFTEQAPNNEVQGGLIEELEWLILERSFQTSETCSVIVYSASVESVDEDMIDVIAVKITDSYGAEINRLYPYHFSTQQTLIGKPIVY